MNEEQLKALMETTCPVCDGSAADEQREMPCSECGYRGAVLTDAGRYLLGLILHHTQRVVDYYYGEKETVWAGSLSQGLGGETVEYAGQYTRESLSRVQ